MSSSLNRIKKNIIEAMQSANNQGTSAYDSVAEVRRVDGDTAWVHIAGGVDETPVKLTIAAKAGDTVQVRVGGGRAWITGNASAPPTDDHMANTAQNTADKAQSSADKAQNTATEAAKTADNYISSDSNGIMVSENKGATKETPSNATKNNVLITEKDVQIRNGQKTVASYGKIIEIGSENGNMMYISADDFKIKNGTSDVFDITVDKNLSSLKIKFIPWDGKEAEQQVASGNIYRKTIVLDEAFNSIESICTVAKNDEGSWDYWFSENEGPYYFTTSGNNSITIVIDGTNTEAQAANWSFQEELRISYYSKETYYSTVGCNNLFASEKISATTMRVADVVRARRVECDSIDAGWLTANIISGTGTATATTGRIASQPRWWQCGNIVQMEFTVEAKGSVASGSNIAAGYIKGVPRPVTLNGLRSVSYYGDNANVTYVSRDGGFTTRNCGKDALASGNNAIGTFTYITNGTMLY